MSNDTAATFDVNRFGTFTTIKALLPPILSQYVATLFTVVATAFIGTLYCYFRICNFKTGVIE
jgi:hypothetical protein